jgi:hypothetical protein
MALALGAGYVAIGVLLVQRTLRAARTKGTLALS